MVLLPRPGADAGTSSLYPLGRGGLVPPSCQCVGTGTLGKLVFTKFSPSPGPSGEPLASFFRDKVFETAISQSADMGG